MIHRQLVNVYNANKAAGKNVIEKTGSSVVLPAVFSVGIRPDIVNFVHTNISKIKYTNSKNDHIPITYRRSSARPSSPSSGANG